MGLESYVKKKFLRDHIPFIIITSYQGLEVYFPREDRWSMKIPYTFQEGKYTIGFSLENSLSIYADGVYSVGSQQELKDIFTDIEWLQQEAYFENMKQEVIADTVQSYIQSTLDLNDENAYSVTIPLMSTDFSNAVDSLSMIAFIQGLPVLGKRYSTFGFGGTKVIKKKKYIGVVTATGRKEYYESSIIPNDAADIFNTAKAAAEHGYYPMIE